MAKFPKTTLIIGASENPERYANMAANRLVSKGHPIINLGKKEGIVAGEPIYTDRKLFDNVHTITLYINPLHQKEWYEYIFTLNPQRIIFNPGTENPELERLAQQKGIETIEGCTLVMLSIDNF
ncbi:MAG: CoA-binding protein [Thermoflexibacter sp.]|jgi:hypothetical protein|nr:CoA-binding protein [Thermoflexibacter sp.]